MQHPCAGLSPKVRSCVLGENETARQSAELGAFSEKFLFVQANSEKMKLPVCDLEFLLLLGKFVIYRRCVTWTHRNVVRKQKESHGSQSTAKGFNLSQSHLKLTFSPLHIPFIFLFLNMNQPVKHTHTNVNWNLHVIFFRRLMAKKQPWDLKPLAVPVRTIPYAWPCYHRVASRAAICSHS